MRLCVIPARGGSKRIPRKNIKEFIGKPIIAYSIKAAIDSKCFDKVIVSTDDLEIAKIAKTLGADIPFMRPEELSNDFAGISSVSKHAIEWFEKNKQVVNEVCCLFATAPFIQVNTIIKAYEQMKREKAECCFTATSFEFPIQRAIKISENNRVIMINPESYEARSQDLDKAYHDAGQLYWAKAEFFKKNKTIFSIDSTPYILPRNLVQDIDNSDDWQRAELMYEVLKQRGDKS